MFTLSTHQISPEVQRATLKNSSAGALVVFEGWVRNENDGKRVQSLEYEAYADLAISAGNGIIEEAKDRFGVLEIHCVHRIGQLQIGDLAVWIGVAAAHRADAFDASRFVIDQIKQRVPIWKKEHFQDASAHWVGAETQDTATKIVGLRDQ